MLPSVLKNPQLADPRHSIGFSDSCTEPDKESPWAPYGEYLAARAMVRKATLTTTNDGKLEMAGLRAAQANLERVLHDSQSGAMHEVARRLVDYVRFRTEPEKRVVELEQLMTQPDPGPDFKQHLWDYVLLVSGGEQAEVRFFFAVSKEIPAQYTRQGKANHASSLEEEYGGDDGSGPSHMPVRADYLRVLRPCWVECHAQSTVDWRD